MPEGQQTETSIALAGLLEVAGHLERLVSRGEKIMEQLFPQAPDLAITFAEYWAFRWERKGVSGYLVPVEHPHLVQMDDLVGIDHIRDELVRNTEQFVAGYPANNVLLWGERGNGKSSCVKALLKMFGPRGLRFIEVQRWDLLSLPAILKGLRGQDYSFILFCDDLSFGEGEDYRGLKTLLDGGLEERPENVLIYATSNRRHLLPEPMSDNIGGGEIHPEEAVSEKLALSDRFGLTLGISTFDQETFLSIVEKYARSLNLPVPFEELRREAIRWALHGGRRSGRGARQFIDDLAGRLRVRIR
ncbi:ATP-binding protein [Geobacter sp. DSM 9736]|uniref:ATP-binding protein n=1 Tax=Geobacter sp. DSM 9736 TaxID=1277350 RepID=UPI000B5078F9|nr:ATP-binding protein [Geobacter sp. DSM 9736]SNB46081.1 hypothetical protein SAMN06269301_1521 [Geobacter sp. DSM 9736]